MKFKIEHGIPLPPKRIRGATFIAVLRQLGIGDSFVDTKKARKCQYYTLAAMLKIKVAIRSIDNKSYRVWRVK